MELLLDQPRQRENHRNRKADISGEKEKLEVNPLQVSLEVHQILVSASIAAGAFRIGGRRKPSSDRATLTQQ
jgi:hypothetical protein